MIINYLIQPLNRLRLHHDTRITFTHQQLNSEFYAFHEAGDVIERRHEKQIRDEELH